jgi:uncharacterized membrane protein YdjX (TVP38/TMEM64 family)
MQERGWLSLTGRVMMRSMAEKRSIFKWVALCATLLALIIVPFMLFGERLEGWTESLIETAGEHRVAVALILAGLLATDIFLPIASSIVSIACGFLLGFWAGTLASLVGMTLSCVVGFYVAFGPRRALAGRLMGPEEISRLDSLNERFGDWIIVITRPVPVLAEAAVLFAGLGRMRAGRFFLMSTLANTGISIVYAAVGAWSAEVSSFLFAFLASILLPGVVMLVSRGRGKRIVPADRAD